MIIWEFERLGKLAFAGLSVEVVLNALASREVPLACKAWPGYRDGVVILTLCGISVVARTVLSDVIDACWACGHFWDDT
eukprot:9080455-Pyramimonas_sp.AAC.1